VTVVYSHVDCFTNGLGEVLADWAADEGKVMLLGRAGCQLDHAVAETIPATIEALLDEAASLEGGQEARNRRLVHA
jgi:hypothetical protein